jgi:hypothetical protein
MRWSKYKKAVTFGYSHEGRIRTAWGNCKYTFKMLKMVKGIKNQGGTDVQ